jgi:hypothetical protein
MLDEIEGGTGRDRAENVGRVGGTATGGVGEEEDSELNLNRRGTKDERSLKRDRRTECILVFVDSSRRGEGRFT